MNTHQKKNQKAEYISRINRVLDFLEKNLDKTFSLEEIAQVAHFSPFHFHRIFKAMVGEPLNQFIKRLRLEKSAWLLCSKPCESITDIALSCGFQSSAVFSRSFKAYFKMSPSQKRKQWVQKNSKNSQMDGKYGKNRLPFSSYVLNNDYSKIERRDIDMNLNPKIEIKTLEAETVAYVRHIGPFKGNSELFTRLFGELFGWAGARGLKTPDAKILSMCHDNPDITDEDKLRLSVCMSVPKDTPVDGKIGKMDLPGGRYAVAYFEIDNTQFESAWNHMFKDWLPGSGYQPDDRPAFELYLNNPQEHPKKLHQLNICIPIKPL